jgi:fatty acid desaturase
VKSNYYAEHTRALKDELIAVLDRQVLKELHKKYPGHHFAVLARQFLLLALGVIGVIHFRDSWWWIPFAILEGLTIFNFTVLLHEVVHGLVVPGEQPRLARFLGLLYAIPSGISASQFTRWHLDHHAELGSYEGDPKRHHLSPKINKPWFKALYFTPALLPIYFRAAAKETATYPEDLRKRIALERKVTIGLQLSVMTALWVFFGWDIVSKVYLVPYFLVFPVAFALNRLGQHYDIRPEDPAQWSTLMKPSWFWDFAYLWSNYHLEHHYYPGVPFYNLPSLHKALKPFFRQKGMVPQTYGSLLYRYLVHNKKPHTNWSENRIQNPEYRIQNAK